MLLITNTKISIIYRSHCLAKRQSFKYNVLLYTHEHLNDLQNYLHNFTTIAFGRASGHGLGEEFDKNLTQWNKISLEPLWDHSGAKFFISTMEKQLLLALRERCPYSEFFWSVFSFIRLGGLPYPFSKIE